MLDEAARGGDIMDVVVPLRRCWGGDRVPAALILHRGHVADDRQSCRLHAPGSLR
jgi:hypothetical protein